MLARQKEEHQKAEPQMVGRQVPLLLLMAP
jgi:hypothetical protein